MRAHRFAVLLTAVTLFATLTAVRANAQAGHSDYGAVAVKTIPPEALVYIDGERWVGPESDGRLVVQLPPGRHLIEVRAPGYRSYVSEVDIRPGETTPVNVSLAGSVPQQAPPPPIPMRGPAPGPATGIRQVSNEGEESGFAVSTDYRFAELNHHTADLLGGYAGVVYAGHLFVGGGGYWQLDDNHSGISIAYGGAVFEWRQWNNKPVGLTFHTLLGGGDADLNGNFYLGGGPGGPAATPNHSYYAPYYYGYHEGFFVFEPEVQATFRLARDFRVAAGVGYRITDTYHGGLSGDVLNGLSGTISVRFGK